MNILFKVLYLGIILLGIYSAPSWAQGHWKFKLTYESKKLIDSPFFLNTAADVNKNGRKELIATDFGRYGDHIDEWKDWKTVPTIYYNIFVLEWDKKELKSMFSKKWDMNISKTRQEKDRYFMSYEARQMVAWTVGDRTIVETIPPYLGLEWINGRYIIHEQYGHSQEYKVGSWALPWLSPFCYYGHFAWSKIIPPRECLIGIRDFSGKGKPKIVTVLEEEIENKKYKQTLRVRKFEPGFPIEWEGIAPKRFKWWDLPIARPIDRLNPTSDSSLLMTAFGESSWYLFEPDENSKSYRIKPLPALGPMGIEFYDLPDIYLRSTQRKGLKEYWGYRMFENPKDVNLSFIYLLRKATLKPDLTGFITEDIDFPYHKNFVGVGYFVMQDIDGDGLEEIILVEQTAGKLEAGHETVYYSDIKDYIRILKWDGKKYQTMWVSPPYAKRGTKFLVEDIMNTGKKQLVVMTPYGTIQIWERILK